MGEIFPLTNLAVFQRQVLAYYGLAFQIFFYIIRPFFPLILASSLSFSLSRERSRDLERELPIADSIGQGCRGAVDPEDELRNLHTRARETETARDCKASRARSFVKVCWPRRRCSMAQWWWRRSWWWPKPPKEATSHGDSR